MMQDVTVYKVIKVVKAQKMTLREYSAYREGFVGLSVYHDIAEPPKNCSQDTVGYWVGYPEKDGKSFNGELPVGCRYISWAPADVFEAVSEKTGEVFGAGR